MGRLQKMSGVSTTLQIKIRYLLKKKKNTLKLIIHDRIQQRAATKQWLMQCFSIPVLMTHCPAIQMNGSLSGHCGA